MSFLADDCVDTLEDFLFTKGLLNVGEAVNREPVVLPTDGVSN